MEMLQQIIQLVTILFLLSMVCERVADFLKHYLSESQLFKIKIKNFEANVLSVGNTLTKYAQNDELEKERVFRILKINVWSGILIAIILKADLIWIFNNLSDPGKTIGWGHLEGYSTGMPDEWYLNVNYWFLIPGMMLTGCFISFGSKFWHDLLDILYQIKNAKRVLSDPQTYKIDNIKLIEKVLDTYQSDFIKAAYLEAKTKYMALNHVKAIGIKSSESGYYFEITTTTNDPLIEPYYQYVLDDGRIQEIPIKLIRLTDSDKIKAHSIDLSAKIFDVAQEKKWGTIGVVVKSLEKNSQKKYLLTCCHNVVQPIRKITNGEGPITAATMEKETIRTIGIVYKADRDHEMDAALVEFDPTQIDLQNYIPGSGVPQKVRELVNSDRNNTKAYLHGARTGASHGIITSIYNEIKITYNSTEEFTIVDTIAISRNEQAITETGDSGACVVDDQNNVLGLVVAGNSRTTYILPIQTLLKKLNVELA